MTEQTVSYKKFRATLRLGEHTTVTSVADDPRSAVAAERETKRQKVK